MEPEENPNGIHISYKYTPNEHTPESSRYISIFIHFVINIVICILIIFLCFYSRVIASNTTPPGSTSFGSLGRRWFSPDGLYLFYKGDVYLLLFLKFITYLLIGEAAPRGNSSIEMAIVMSPLFLIYFIIVLYLASSTLVGHIIMGQMLSAIVNISIYTIALYVGLSCYLLYMWMRTGRHIRSVATNIAGRGEFRDTIIRQSQVPVLPTETLDSPPVRSDDDMPTTNIPNTARLALRRHYASRSM
jgi:hypothetical protein